MQKPSAAAAPASWRRLLTCITLAVAGLLASVGLAGTPAAGAQDAAPEAGRQGLQGGWAVDDKGNVNFLSSFASHNAVMHEAEAGWVRVNFRLGACFKDWTSTGCNGRTALATYDEVIDIALSHNLRVLALVGHEAGGGTQEQWTAGNAEHAGGNGDNPYLRRFADEAVEVLANHFQDRVRHWEIWNEPNAWTEQDEAGRPKGGSFIYPSNFAWALTRAHEVIRWNRPDAVVISGGLFGHDLGDPAVLFAREPCPSVVASGGEYLCATYEMGMRHAGWRPGAYPFDHIGQHIYVDPGERTSEEKLRFYLDDLRGSYLAYEGPETRKTTHITEFGWSTKDVTPEVQIQNLIVSYDTFRQVPWVTRAYWFHAQDVPEAGLLYGLAEGSGERKRSLAVFRDVAAYNADDGYGDEPVTDPPERPRGADERGPASRDPRQAPAPPAPPARPPIVRQGPPSIHPER